MKVDKPKQVGDRWIVTETDAAGDAVDYSYPTESAANEAYKILSKRK